MLIWELKNQLEDFDVYARDALMNMHWTADQFDDTDYYRLMQIVGAKDPKDREVDPLALMQAVTKG